MPRPPLLSEDEIKLELTELPLWALDNNSITREINATNFAAAVGIINSIAVLAGTLNHHPDILLYGWNKLKIKLMTHDAGGLTNYDFMLAKKIDELNF